MELLDIAVLFNAHTCRRPDWIIRRALQHTDFNSKLLQTPTEARAKAALDRLVLSGYITRKSPTDYRITEEGLVALHHVRPALNSLSNALAVI